MKVKFSDGYSLIEIMVVLTLFALLVLVATQTLFLSLRSAGKSESIGRVRENVEYAINIMERQLREARGIVTCPSTNVTTLSYFDKNSTPTTFSCVNVGVNGYVASGAARLTNQNVSVTTCSFSCTKTGGISPTVTISLEGQDKSAVPNAEKGRASSTTSILVRQF